MSRWQIGLTGGIGSGKSTVAGVWRSMGAHILDADAVAKQLTGAGGRAIDALLGRFGPECLDPTGAMDRDWMRARVFSHPADRLALESILHAMISEELQAAARCHAAGVQVFDVPLLVESPRWRPRLDAIVVVDCDEEVQIERVIRRNGWPRDQVKRVIAQQATRAVRLAAADCVLCNQGIALPELEQRARQVGVALGLSSQHDQLQGTGHL